MLAGRFLLVLPSEMRTDKPKRWIEPHDLPPRPPEAYVSRRQGAASPGVGTATVMVQPKRPTVDGSIGMICGGFAAG